MPAPIAANPRGAQPAAGEAPIAILTTAGKRWFEVYRPANFPALFQTFVDISPTAEGIREFSNRFGPLYFPFSRHSIKEIEEDPSAALIHYEADVDESLEEHAELRRATRLLEACELSALVDSYNERWGGRSKRQFLTELRIQPSGKIAPVFVPKDLSQFLWLQFALHAASNAKLMRCGHCGEPFRVGTGTGRLNTAKFCSNACKVGAFRMRREGRTVYA